MITRFNMVGAWVDLERFPSGEWGVTDSRGGRVRLYDDEEDAREHAVASAACMAAQHSAQVFGTKVRTWDVEISEG